MTWRLLVRFHLVPWLQLWAQAARRGPLLMLVAGFLVLFVVGLTLSGRPLLVLPPGLLGTATVLGLTGLVAALIGAAGRGSAERWTAFFQARPRGASMHRVYRMARALGAWALGGLLVAAVSGPPPLVILAVVVVAPLYALAVGSWIPREAKAAGSRSFLRLPGPVAWWLGEPLLFIVPLLAWALLMGWVVSGGGGFVWAERPPVTLILLDFGWPTLVALLWSEAVSRIPYAFFRLARAPFRRVFVVVLTPLALATLVVAVVAASLSATLGEALRALVLTATGTAFWTLFWLRWGPANLAHLMLFFTLFLVGVALEVQWWPVWALVQSVGAVGLAVSWRTQYYEGETDAGS